MGVFRDAMDEAMVLRGLAPRTREIYLQWVARLVRFCRVSPDRLTTKEVRAFLLDLTQERKLAFSTFNQALNAVRFFFTEVLKQPFALGEFHFQKPPRRLPVVMNDEEVRGLLECAHSLRDRALFETAYATGMRLGELTRLLITDIDSKRMVIRVDQGKGRKDRYVMLSASLLETLRGYWRQARPKRYLFPGDGGKRPLSHFVGAEGLRSGEGRSGDREAGFVPHAAPQFRDPPTGRRGERAHDPVSARASQPADDGALHARGRELPSPDAQPARPAARQGDAGESVARRGALPDGASASCRASGAGGDTRSARLIASETQSRPGARGLGSDRLPHGGAWRTPAPV